MSVMSDGGKGSGRRPQKVDEQTFASNWDRIFSGRSSTAEQGSLTASVVSSNLTAPATYVDDETGAQVTEAWWPGDKHDG